MMAALPLGVAFLAGGVSYDSIIQLDHLPPPVPATVFSRGCTLEKSLRLATISGGLCVTTRELVYPELSADLLERECTRWYTIM